MADGGKVSEERITETLITIFIEEELEDRPLEDVPSLTPDAVEVENEEEKSVVKKVFAWVSKIYDKVKDDPEIQEGIHGVAQLINLDRDDEAYKMLYEMFKKIFQDGITWEKIVISLIVVGKVVGRIGIMTARHHFVPLIQSWTLDFFKKNLLGWILEKGGWSRCSVQS